MGFIQTVVDTNGKIIEQVPVLVGYPLIVVSADHPSQVVMRIDEVSDDETVNVFIHTEGEIQSSMLHDESFVGVGEVDEDSPNYEILIPQGDM